MGIRTSQLTENTTLNALDLLYGVDVSDLTHSPDGTSKKIKLSTLITFLETNIDSLGLSNFDASAIVTEAEGIRDNDNDTTFPTSGAVVDAIDDGILYGMHRQAVINGNFDIWQRGVSSSAVTSNVFDLADRWKRWISADGGSLPTLTQTRQPVSSGELYKSQYYYRVAPNGAGTSLGASAYHFIEQSIEDGTKYLCGLGKKITLSFWARSSILNKKIGIGLVQAYGTGGSSPEDLTGVNVTLTSDWTKYTYTFDTNTLVGKTFGTTPANLSLGIYFMWGSGTYGTKVGSAGVAETFVGSGNIDIAQIQICAGEDDLPFCPKSYIEELRDCQRYYYRLNRNEQYEVFSPYCTARGTTSIDFIIFTPVPMRTKPVISYSSLSHIYLGDGSGALTPTNISAFANTRYSYNCLQGLFTVSGATQYRPYYGVLNTAGSWIALDAEF